MSWLYSIIDSGKKKNILTEEEQTLRRSEVARRRKNQSIQRAEKDKASVHRIWWDHQCFNPCVCVYCRRIQSTDYWRNRHPRAEKWSRTTLMKKRTRKHPNEWCHQIPSNMSMMPKAVYWWFLPLSLLNKYLGILQGNHHHHQAFVKWMDAMLQRNMSPARVEKQFVR